MEEYIYKILYEEFKDEQLVIDTFESSELLKYFDLKSNAIHGTSKSRRSLANWYSIYSILHFYSESGFINNKKEYLEFGGFPYTKLFNFMRNLYGGQKLQNHALNSRVNGEFLNKIAKDPSKPLILINEGKYLLNQSYLYVNGKDLTPVYLRVVNKYIELLKEKDHALFGVLKELQEEYDTGKQKEILSQLLVEESEARIFEIVS